MVTVGRCLVLAMCLVYLPTLTVAFLKRYSHQKRFGQVPGSTKRNSFELPHKILFKKPLLEPVSVGIKHSSLVLECHAGGKPNPTIHWLKDGVRIPQGSHHTSHDDSATYEDHNVLGGPSYLRLSSTSGRLYLDCLTEADEGEYTCVSESPRTRITQSTVLRVEEPKNMVFSDLEECVGKTSTRKVAPARIYMWSTNRLEYTGSKVQLFCRAEGVPEPRITWYDTNNKPITEDDDNYRIAKNGDLIIRDITFFQNMGDYTCEAHNGYGTDSTETFLYPTRREGSFRFGL